MLYSFMKLNLIAGFLIIFDPVFIITKIISDFKKIFFLFSNQFKKDTEFQSKKKTKILMIEKDKYNNENKN